jgi:hypothetical protein
VFSCILFWTAAGFLKFLPPLSVDSGLCATSCDAPSDMMRGPDGTMPSIWMARSWLLIVLARPVTMKRVMACLPVRNNRDLFSHPMTET